MKVKVKKIFSVIIGLIIGLIAGLLYHKLIGCKTGTCPITSNPWMSMIYGSIMGLVLTLSLNLGGKDEHKRDK